MSSNMTAWLNFALQQMAAESYLQGIDWQNVLLVKPRLLLGNNNLSGISPTDVDLTGKTRFSGVLADRFLSQYEIVDHHANDATGFSATLMRDTLTGEYTLSFRSTESQYQVAGGDWERDGLPGADGEIAGTGFALAQLVSMEKYYRALKADPTKFPPGAVLNVTGYSLGGHLATVFTELHASEVHATYTFNGAGRGRITGGTAGLSEAERIREMLQVAETQFDAIDPTWFASGNTGNVYTDQRYRDVRQATILGFSTTNSFLPPGEIGTGPGFDKITQLVGLATHNDQPYVANSGIHAAQTTIFIEDQPNFDGLGGLFGQSGSFGTTHSITLIVDSLALAELIQEITPTLGLDAIERLFAASSSLTGSGFVGVSGLAEGNSLEKILDGLRKAFDPNAAPTPFGRQTNDFGRLTFRNQFYAHLEELRGKNALLVSLVDLSSTEVFAKAKTTTSEALAYRYALRELNPFVMTGLDYETLHNQDHSLDIYDANTGIGVWTQLALSDRAELLAEKVRFNQTDGTPTSPTLFVDETTVFNNQRGATATEAVIFGDAEGREYLGRRGNDHIYGEGGDDVVHGAAGQDYLEGNDGNDELYGEADNDTLLGQQGIDKLDGGTGADRMSGGAGDDTYIVDNSGDRVIEFANQGGDEVRSSVSFTLSPDVERLTLTGSAAIDGTGNESDNLMIGNDAANTLRGGGGKDHLFGGGGKDILEGAAEDDILEGGAGDDVYRYVSGDGVDRIEDTQGKNTIFVDGRVLLPGLRQTSGAGGVYTSLDGQFVYTQSGGDLLVSRPGGSTLLILNENFQSGQFGITLQDEPSYANGLETRTNADYTGVFNDLSNSVFFSGPYNQNVHGLGGNDSIFASIDVDGNDQLYGDGGDDRLQGDGGNDRLFGGEGADVLFGQSGDDRLEGGTGDDQLLGGYGVDVLVGGEGSDLLLGDLGTDIDDPLPFDPSRGTGDLLDGGDGNDLMEGEAGNDTLTGGAGNDQLFGDYGLVNNAISEGFTAALLQQGGDDSLDGGDGDDQVYGGVGDDLISGGAGNDALWGDYRADDQRLPGQARQALGGNDVIDGGDGADFIEGGVGDDILYGGQGDDTLYGEDHLSLANPGNDVLDGGGGDDFLAGGRGDDVLTGGTGNDQLYGDDGQNVLDGGADTLLGGEGDDQLYGGGGDDVLTGGAGNDGLFGQDGNDLLSGDAGDDLLNGGLGNDQLDGGDGIDDVQGREGDDLVVGGAGNDFLYGDGNDPTILSLVGGNDTLDGEEGDDQLWGGAGQDQLFGGEGADQLVGEVGNDQLYGEEGDDSLFGDSPFFPSQAGTDLLDGGDGNDVLQGGGGNDQLEGGSGDDVLFGEFWNVLGAPTGDDDLHGGLGNDRLVGGGGLDTYRFNLGDGIDSIEDNAVQSNRLVFGAGLTVDSLSLDVAAGDSLLVRIGTNGDAVEIVGFGVNLPAGFHSIDQFEFADGTVLTDSQLLARGFHLSAPVTGGTVLGTAYADHIEGSHVDDWIQGRDGSDVLNGGQGDDVLEGEEGDDELNGGAGNDRLYGSAGSNVLRGGEGNDLLDSAGVGDQLFGGTGDDSYHLWSVSQIISEDVNAGTDTIYLAPTASLTFQTPDNVENVKIQDDFYLDPTMQVHLVGNALDNQLSGSNRLDGRGGNDTLIGIGDNTFVFGRGYGHDIVQTGTQLYAHTGLDQVEFMSDIAPVDLMVENHGRDLLLKVNGTTDQLTMESYFVSPSTTVDQFVFADGTIWSLTDIESRMIFVGSDGDDTFLGTFGDDTIRGLGGNDQIRASLGNDTLDGGTGSDFLEGWSGNDTYVFRLGYGQDVIDEQGDAADVDTLKLEGINPGDITLRATSDFGSDAILTINNTTDQVTLTGFFAFDALRVDRIQFSDGTIWDYNAMLAHTEGVTLEGTEDADYLYGNVTNDMLSGLGGDDSLNGGAGHDILLGGSGADQLNGSTGNDFLDGGMDADIMIGGSGNDVYVVDNVGDAVTEQAGQGADTVQSSIDYTLGANLENLTLTGSASINGTGNSLNNILIGNGAANVLTGGVGNDVYVVGVGDTVIETTSAGTDTIKSDISWTLGANLENLVLTGTVAVDGIGNSLANTLTGNSAANTLNGGSGADTLIGEQGDDLYVVDNVSDKITELINEGVDTVQSSVTYTLSANMENLTLVGSSAINGTGNSLDNVLTGNSAANRLTGGAGNDTYVVGAGDTVVEAVNAGTDTVQSSVTHTLAANVENLTLTGAAAISGTGNALNNILVGNSAANTLTGGAGNDTYVVGTGDTVVESVNAGTDVVQSSVSWTLGANVENLILAGSSAINGTGNALANILTGNSGGNALAGGDGNDTLSGGRGNDTLNGGTGNDVFQFARGDGQDIVTDASGSSDRLDFGSGINPLDIILSQSANDLRIAVYGSTDQVTIANWYGGATNQIEMVQAGNGQQLLNTQVNQLIQAMAGFTQQTGLSWDQAIAQRPQDVQQILAANWH